jgi:DNA-binding HxlR family transcriptional regulator
VTFENHDPLAGGGTSSRPIMVLLDLLGKRWTLRVVWELGLAQTIRFLELQQLCGISPTVLSKRLNELVLARIVEQDGRVYRLTEMGHQLLRTLLQLSSWSEEWMAARAEAPTLRAGAPVATFGHAAAARRAAPSTC